MVQQQVESPTTVDEFKKWAAQAAQRGNRVYRWYARFVNCGQCYELDTYGDMLYFQKQGWQLHKDELKKLGFAVVKDGSVFMFIVNADNADKWLAGGILE